jgi:hypothetical protein|tara:strand:- start:42 stop:722 length:681 start_codon:yes stop_codon:yes gene_type:complete
MSRSDKDIIIDPKYAPPYPQEFHRFWPTHAIKAAMAMLIAFVAIIVLAYLFQVPTDHTRPPLPDHGAYIPAPEWFLFFVFEPFWHLTGKNAVWLQVGTFWIPLVGVVFLLLVPFLFGRKKASAQGLPTARKVVLGLGALTAWVVLIGGVVGSGYHTKTTGCISCHTPMADRTQALPPADMARYFRDVRQMEIDIGRHRLDESGETSESYKDANWQLRHFYAPTENW